MNSSVPIVIGEFDEALHLLRRNSRTPSDSWLMAAEVAVASVARKTPKFAKQGAQILKLGQFSAFHTSELASALGSLEMATGNHRLANRLFAEALKSPTNNALAQVVWASKITGLEEIDPHILEKANANEALTWNNFNAGEWSRAVGYADKWGQEEAFSARPALLASSVAASFLDAPETAEFIAKRALETNPGHPPLINNVAFALILQGKPREGLATMESINKDAMRFPDAICLLATCGMAHFRLGDEAEGHKYYSLAISRATGHENEGLKVVASLYLARERVFRGHKDAVKEFKKAFEFAEKMQSSHIPALAEHLLKDVEKAAQQFGVQTNIKKKIVLLKGPLL